MFCSIWSKVREEGCRFGWLVSRRYLRSIPCCDRWRDAACSGGFRSGLDAGWLGVAWLGGDGGRYGCYGMMECGKRFDL
jgi:hypothetical protein